MKSCFISEKVLVNEDRQQVAFAFILLLLQPTGLQFCPSNTPLRCVRSLTTPLFVDYLSQIPQIGWRDSLVVSVLD